MSVSNLDIFQVIADPSRRKILGMHKEETYNINALAENFEMVDLRFQSTLRFYGTLS